MTGRIRFGSVALMAALVVGGMALIRWDGDLTRAHEARLRARLEADAARVASAATARWEGLRRRVERTVEEAVPTEASRDYADVVARGLMRNLPGGPDSGVDSGLDSGLGSGLDSSPDRGADWRAGGVAAQGAPSPRSIWRTGPEGGARWEDGAWVGLTPRDLSVLEPWWGSPSVPFGGGEDATAHVVRIPEEVAIPLVAARRADADGWWVVAFDAVEAAEWLGPLLLEDAGLAASDVRVTLFMESDLWSSGDPVDAEAGVTSHRGDRARSDNRAVGGSVTAPVDDLMFFESGAATRSPFSFRVAPARGSVTSVVADARRARRMFGGMGLLLAGLAGAALLTAAVRAQRLADRQRAFVSLVGHELRTPLTAFRAAVENLRDGVVKDPARYAGMLETQIRRMEELAEDALAAARSGTVDAAEGDARMDPTAVVEEVVAEFPGTVEVRARDPGAGPPLRGSPRLLRRAVRNLIRNAELHGRPPVTATVEWDGASWVVTVTDAGPGFAGEDLSRLTRPFQRGADAEREQRPGSGLGLSVVEECVAQLGGRVAFGGEGPASVALILPPPHDVAAPSASDSGEGA